MKSDNPLSLAQQHGQDNAKETVLKLKLREATEKNQALEKEFTEKEKRKITKKIKDNVYSHAYVKKRKATETSAEKKERARRKAIHDKKLRYGKKNPITWIPNNPDAVAELKLAVKAINVKYEVKD